MGLDVFTKSLLKHHPHLKTHLIKINKPNSQPNNDIIHVLDTVHKSISTSPDWLQTFLKFKTFSHDQQFQFITKYGGLIKIQHAINSMKFIDKTPVRQNWKSNYFSSWQSQVNDYWFPYTKDYEIQLGAPSQLKKFINENNLGKLTSINIDPDRFGNPKPQINIKNSILKSLIALQKNIKSSKLIPLHNLNEIENSLVDKSNNSLNLSDKYREAYIHWLSEVYSIDKDGKVIKSKVLLNKYIPSPNLINLYKF